MKNRERKRCSSMKNPKGKRRGLMKNPEGRGVAGLNEKLKRREEEGA